VAVVRTQQHLRRHHLETHTVQRVAPLVRREVPSGNLELAEPRGHVRDHGSPTGPHPRRHRRQQPRRIDEPRGSETGIHRTPDSRSRASGRARVRPPTRRPRSPATGVSGRGVLPGNHGRNPGRQLWRRRGARRGARRRGRVRGDAECDPGQSTRMAEGEAGWSPRRARAPPISATPPCDGCRSRCVRETSPAAKHAGPVDSPRRAAAGRGAWARF
jgi:hypothetical protein